MPWEDNVIEERADFGKPQPTADDPYRLPENLILDTDSYKFSHPMQYPEGLTEVEGYIESRGGRYGLTEFAGLQAYLKRYLCRPVKRWMVEDARAFAESHGVPFPYEGWMRVLTEHGGYIPLEIRSVLEGTVLPVSNIMTRIRTTDPELPWLKSWYETQTLRAIWFPTTVGTKGYYGKKVILEALVKSSDDPMGEIYFKLHDFGARGVSSRESAALGGMAHCFNFKGSDTCVGVEYANHYYNEPMAAFSIPAAEHSTMTIKGREGELDQMRRMLEQFAKPGAILACVSDSYDIWNAVENYWGEELHDEVKNSGATLVIRPDSGDPAEVNVRLLQILERKIGMKTNMKGYKVLPKYFRLIQGDGNDDEDSIRKVFDALLAHGYSASNIAFGMGGGLLQKIDRDTQRFAQKACRAVIDNEVLDVKKDPVTDKGKRSKAGRLDLVFREGEYRTVQGDQPDSLLVPVFRNGKLLVDQNLSDIRKRAEAGLV
jgi:nicotinamide phosphoribosyltransferase